MYIYKYKYIQTRASLDNVLVVRNHRRHTLAIQNNTTTDLPGARVGGMGVNSALNLEKKEMEKGRGGGRGRKRRI